MNIIAYEGDAWVQYSKPHSWRWQNETAIHLPDGRVFGDIDSARAADGPQYVEVRAVDTVSGLPAVQAFPAIAAFVRGLYVTYFGREPDSGGWEFWTNEIASGRKTQADTQTVFSRDPEAVSYAARYQSPPIIAVVPPATQPAPAAITGAGFLNSKVLGIDVKLLLIGGVAAYFLLGEK